MVGSLRFHGRLFKLEIQEIFKTAFLLKTIIWNWFFFFFQVLQRSLVKNIARHSQRLNKNETEKEKEKQKIRKSQSTSTIFSVLLFQIGKLIFCWKTHFWKNLVYIVTFVLHFCHVRLIGDEIIKHQRPYIYALALKTPHFDPEQLAIDSVY